MQSNKPCMMGLVRGETFRVDIHGLDVYRILMVDACTRFLEDGCERMHH